MKGQPEIDTQKVEPENSQLGDLGEHGYGSEFVVMEGRADVKQGIPAQRRCCCLGYHDVANAWARPDSDGQAPWPHRL